MSQPFGHKHLDLNIPLADELPLNLMAHQPMHDPKDKLSMSNQEFDKSNIIFRSPSIKVLVVLTHVPCPLQLVSMEQSPEISTTTYRKTKLITNNFFILCCVQNNSSEISRFKIAKTTRNHPKVKTAFMCIHVIK